MDLNDTITMPPSETNERISNDTSAPSNQINDIEQEDVDDSNEPNSISLLIDSNKGDSDINCCPFPDILVLFNCFLICNI